MWERVSLWVRAPTSSLHTHTHTLSFFPPSYSFISLFVFCIRPRLICCNGLSWDSLLLTSRPTQVGFKILGLSVTVEGETIKHFELCVVGWSRVYVVRVWEDLNPRNGWSSHGKGSSLLILHLTHQVFDSCLLFLSQDRVSAVQLLEFNIKLKAVQNSHRACTAKLKQFWKVVVDRRQQEPNTRDEYLVRGPFLLWSADHVYGHD